MFGLYPAKINVRLPASQLPEEEQVRLDEDREAPRAHEKVALNEAEVEMSHDVGEDNRRTARHADAAVHKHALALAARRLDVLDGAAHRRTQRVDAVVGDVLEVQD